MTDELVPSADDKNWAMIAHISQFAGYMIPFGNVLGPMVVWMMKRDQSSFVAEHAKESLNFQITATIAMAVCVPLTFVFIGIPLIIAVVVIDLVFTVIAAMAASKGETYRYPISIRLVT